MARAALVAGASGLVGGYCLRALLASADFDRVVALLRKPLSLEHDKLRQLAADLDHLPELPPLTGGALFCALGTTIRKAGSQGAFRRVDFEYPMRLAKAALAAGVKDITVVSSIGADAKSSNFYLRTKGELEQELAKLPFRALHIFQPSLLLGERAEQRTGERIGTAVSRVLRFLLIGGLEKYRPVEAEAVGRAMVRSGVRGVEGRHVYQWREIVNA